MPDLRSLPPISTDAICRKWPLYECLVRDRLLAGARNYGDASFLRSQDELINEISQELMDVTGWAFILWCKVQEMRKS